jgi:predicted RNA-binding protein YlxR (DUF448 family)
MKVKTKKGVKRNHEAQRTCLGCRQVDTQQSMVRLAALACGVVLDPARRLGGRGGYLHRRARCLELFVKSKVKRFNSLRRSLDRSARVDLVNLLAERLAPNAEL